MNNILSEIVELINSKNYLKAENNLAVMISKDPKNFILNKLFGVSRLAQKRYNTALKCFNICYEQKKDDYDVNVNLSFLFVKIQNYELAIKFGKEALNCNQSRPEAYHNLAESYLYLLDFDLAKENILSTIKLRGGFDSKEFLGFTDLVNLYAEILLARNEIDNFISFAQKILDGDSYHSGLFLKLIQNDISNIKPHYIENINKALSNNKFETLVKEKTFKADMNFCLARYYAKSDKKKSEEYYIIANKNIADMQRQSLFVRQKLYLEIVDHFNSFDYQNIKEKIDSKKGKGLIFVVGMPRSGTTLTESIISTSQDTKPGGEKVFFPIQLQSKIMNFKKLSTGKLGSIEQQAQNLDFFEELGDGYLNNIRMQRGNKKFYVDKLPENYLFYKFIKLALPGSKFVHVQRDPWDNAISLYKENYTETVFFASSFFGIAVEYANYENLIKYWKEIDGENCMLNIKYEELVTNTGLIADKIWSYCDLKGEYAPEERKNHFANTASRQQVTKEIYTTSLKKSDFEEFESDFYKNLENQREYWVKKMSQINQS